MTLDPRHDERAAAPASDFLDRARTDVVRGSLWTVASAVLSLPSSLAVSILLARALGPTDLGRFATYTAAYAVIVALTNFGWSEATVQWLAAADARGERIHAHQLIRRCSGYHLVVAGPLAGVATFVMLSSASTACALVAAVAVWVTQCLGTSTVILTAGARNARAAQIKLVSILLSQSAVVATLLVSHSAVVAWTVQLSYALIGCTMALGLLPAEERRQILRPEFSLRLPSGFVTYSASACATGLVATLVAGRSEVLVLDSHHLLEAAGVFTVVTGLAGQMTAPVDSLFAPLMPIAAGVFAVDVDMARRSFRRSLRVSAAVSAATMVVLVPAGVALVEPVYGPAYGDARLPFLVLGLTSCLSTVMGPVGAFAFATRSAQLVLRTQLICLILDVALVLSLVPFIGLWGAVIANAGAQISGLALLSNVVSRKLGVSLAAIGEDLSLFWLGAGLGIAAGLFCATLAHGWVALAPLAECAALGGLWATMRVSTRLQFADEDLELLARGGPPRLVSPLISGLRRARVVRTAGQA